MPITKDTPVGEIIKDFEVSDAPQFKGKSKEKRRQMAIAASYNREETELGEGRSPGNDDAHRFMLKDKIASLEKEGKPATAQKNRLQMLLAKRKAEKRGIVTEEGGRWVYDNNGKAREISAAEAAATRKSKVASRDAERAEQDKADERAADRRGGYGKGLEEDILLEVKPNKVTKPVHTHSIAGNMSHEDKKQEVSLGMSQSGRHGWFTNNMMAISLTPEEHAKFSKDPVAAKAHASKFGFKLKEETMTESVKTIGSPRTGITADLLDKVRDFQTPADPTDTVAEVNTYTAASMTKLAGWQDQLDEVTRAQQKEINDKTYGGKVAAAKKVAHTKFDHSGDPEDPNSEYDHTNDPHNEDEKKNQRYAQERDDFRGVSRVSLKSTNEDTTLDEATKPKVIPLGSDRHPAADPSHPNHAAWKAAKPKSVRKPTAADMFKTPRVSAHEKPISAEDAFKAVKKEGIGEADHTVYAHNVVHMHNGKKVAAKHIGTYHSINGAKDMGFEHDDPNAGDTEEIFHHIVHRDSENPKKLHVYQTGHAKNWHGIDESVELGAAVFELDETSSYSRENQYGLRHREWKGKQGGGTLTTVESWHKSPEARDKHRAKVEQKDGFHEFVSTSNPRTNEEVELDENRMGPAAIGFKVPKSAADPGKERELRKQEKSIKVNRGDKREPEFSQKQGELGVGSRGAYGVRVEGTDFKTIFVSKVGKAIADPRKPIAKTLEDPFKKKLIQNEEVELDEVSDNTLKSYKSKALFDVRAANARLSAFEPELKSKNVAKDTHQLVKRSIGVIRANKQLKREPKEVVTESNADDERDERRDAREPASTSKAKAPYKLEPAMISGRKFVQQGAKVPRGYEMTSSGRIVKKSKSKERALGEETELDEGIGAKVRSFVRSKVLGTVRAGIQKSKHDGMAAAHKEINDSDEHGDISGWQGRHERAAKRTEKAWKNANESVEMGQEETTLNEGDLRLVSIYKNKKGEAHTLWQTGQYEYHMTPSKQSVSGHFPKTKTWNKSLEDVHKELGENGFKIHHTPLSA